MGQKLSLEDIDCKGKKVLLRVDFNVPMKEGNITDDSRIVASLPTIERLLKEGSAVILMSHLGRPNGKKDPTFSLKPCSERLAKLLGTSVLMAPDCIGADVKQMAAHLKGGEVLLLENLRFHKGEEEGDISFAKEIASLGDLYVNDAFGSAHRAHASITALPSFFKDKALMGLLMEKEIRYLNEALLFPKRPFCVILGGAKISTKFKLIEKLLQKADNLLLGGAMAYTFFKALSIPVGNSLIEEEYVAQAKQWLDDPLLAARLHLPQDSVMVQEIKPDAPYQIVDMTAHQGIPSLWKGVDIGPKTIKTFSQKIKEAHTVFWNGPLGVFEIPPFGRGTEAIARSLATGGTEQITVVGGGDSASALAGLRLNQAVTHVSTGGGASIEYIEMGCLPGIEALSDAPGGKKI